MPAIRKFSLTLASTSILLSLALCFSLAGSTPLKRIDLRRDGASKPRRPFKGQAAPTMAMPLIAPLFLQDAQFTSTVSLVNASNSNTHATITLRSLSGQIILQRQVPLLGSSPVQVPVQQLLQEANSSDTHGSIVVEQSPELKGLAVLAQLSITYQGSHASYIDEELAMPDSTMGSSILRGVARSKGESTLVAISSLSQTTQKIQIDCLNGNANRTSKTVDLPANATVITNACSPGDLGSQSLTDIQEETNSNGTNAAGFQLTSNAGPAQFAAFGLTRRRVSGDVLFGAVPFNDPKLAVSSSTVFAGLPVGPADLLGPDSYKPYVALANFSLRRAHVTVTFNKTSGVFGNAIASSTPVADFELQPQQTENISLTGLQGDPGLRNSFVVTYDCAPGDIGVSMASKVSGAEGEVELLAKDAEQSENAGAHPWSIADGADSTLLLFNHTDQQRQVMITIFNGSQLWQKLFKLSPFETFTLSMSKLVNDQVLDDRRKALPVRLVAGEITWAMSDPKTITGRLLVSNRIAAMARSFSCMAYSVLCPPTSISGPGGTTMQLGNTATFQGNWTSCWAQSATVCNGQPGGAASPTVSWGWSAGMSPTSSCNGGQTCPMTATAMGAQSVTFTAYLHNCTIPATSNFTVTHCPTSVSISSTTPIPLENVFPTDLTGVGIVAHMQVGPSSAVPYDNSTISESVSVNGVMQNTCTNIRECTGGPNFTVGTGGSLYNTNFTAMSDIFYDGHTFVEAPSYLDAQGLNQCTYSCNQTYQAVSDPNGNSCGGTNLGSFLITYTLTKDNINGTPVTRTAVTKQ